MTGFAVLVYELATGPLTQATGPPGPVGGGNLYVEGEPRTNRKINVI